MAQKPAPKKTTESAKDTQLREHLLYLLKGGGAHIGFEDAVRDLPADQRGVRPEGASHSAWEIIEHMRLAQQDILEFSRDASWESPPWPEGYWPAASEPPDAKAWDASIKQFHADLKTMCALVKDPSTDLYARIPHGDGQTILREALLIADHNAYHLGELVVVRRLLGEWNH